jgi:hypothetical protein
MSIIKVFIFFIMVLIVLNVFWYFNRETDPILNRLKEHLAPVHSGIKHAYLYEADKSYTINKDKIYMCLKDNKGEYYPFNMLVYVFLHEYAHAINKEDIGHTPSFHDKFDKLLDIATEMKLYDPDIPVIDNYCNY